jgi:EAL domain-containing protein (putative c-di-GMP-specific phosphodiesterase class I)/GGDEF domain-containing protein
MKLSTKIAIYILVLLFLVCIGMFSISVKNQKNFFVDQLNSNANDTASSLGLSLSHALSSHDKAMMLAMVQAVFDRGYFSKVQIKDMRGNILVSRQTDGDHKHAPPRWFQNLFSLHKTSQSAIVMRGWSQVGRVEVVTDPTWAYISLWKNAKGLMLWYLIISVLAIALAIFFVKLMLRPFYAIAKQARAITNREFITQPKLPRTPEFRYVTKAMNYMVIKVKDMFDQQLAQIKLLRTQNYSDELTQLSNRRLFVQEVKNIVYKEDDFIPGFICFISLDGLENVNTRLGYETGDELLVYVSSGVEKILKPYKSAKLYRVRGSQLAMIARYMNIKQFEVLVSSINAFLSNYLKEHPICNSYIAATDYHQFEDLSDLFARTDQLLNAARNKSDHCCSSFQSEGPGLLITTDMLKQAMGREDFSIYSQKVNSDAESTASTYHREVFMRLSIDGELVSAGFFMSFAEKEGLASALDCYVLDKILATQAFKDGAIAMNLSSQSVVDEMNMQVFLTKLGNVPKKQRRNLMIEINEQLLISDAENAKDFINKIHELGYGIGIDHIGAHFTVLEHLKDLPLHYMKIDGAIFEDILDNEYKQFYVHYFNEIAKTMDVKLIATHIENKQQLGVLAKLDIHYFQGNYISKTEALH